MTSTFYPSSNSAFKGMAPPQQPPTSPPPQPSDVSMSSARVRLSYQYDSFEGGPSPQYHEGQQQQQQQQQHVPHQPATVGTTAKYESTNATNDDGWGAHYDEEIRLRREELARLQEGNKASVHLLENKARSGLSPAFSPSVQQFVANVMARDSTTSAFAAPLSGRTPLGPDNERTPTTPGGGDFLQTPRTAGSGTANPSSSLRTQGALGFLKDEASRLRVDLEQQAGLLASEKQYNDQLQDELRDLAGEREGLRQELEARERQMREYERALAEAQAAEEEKRNEDRQRQESFQAQVDQLHQELAQKHQDYEQFYEFSELTQAKALDTETRLQAIIEELQRASVTGLEQQQQQQQESDAAAHAQATLVYQEEQLLALHRELEELRQQAATTEEAARAATQALEEEVRQQREATEAYRAEAQQLRWEREQQQQQQQQQQEAAAAEAEEAAVAVMLSPALSSTTPVGGLGVDVEALTQALAAAEAAKEALEGDLRQQQQDAEWYRTEIQRLQQEQSRDEEGQGVAAAAVPDVGQQQEEEASARRALEEQLQQQQQEMEWYRSEVERLQESQVEGQGGATVMAPEAGLGGEEEAAARQALEDALPQQQDAAAWLQAEVEQLKRERGERQAAVATPPADAYQGAEGEGMVQALEGEIQRQRDLLTGYEAELEQLRQEKAAVAAGMPTELATTAPLTAPVVGQQGEAGGQMVSLQPVGDKERQTLERTIQALEEANRQLVEGFQKVEAKLTRVNELELEKRDLLMLVDELKDVLDNERESHHRHLEESLSGLKHEVERLVDEVHRLEAAEKELRELKYNESLFVLKRVTHNVLAKQQLKTKYRAICRWLTAVNAMQGEELVAVREQAAMQAAQAEEVKQLEGENKTLLEALQREPPTRGGVMAGAAPGGTAARGGSGVVSFLSSLFKLFFVVGLLMFLQQHFAMMGGGSSYCYIETARITM